MAIKHSRHRITNWFYVDVVALWNSLPPHFRITGLHDDRDCENTALRGFRKYRSVAVVD
jgi:hypothetical protein